MRRDTIAARRAAGATDDRRKRIVEAAVRAIEEHGADAGLGVVAGQAGLPRPHVYRHFTGKDDLDREVARHAAAMLSDWIRPTLTGPGSQPELIRGVVGRVSEWAVDHPNLYRFRARHGSPAADALAAHLRDPRPPTYVVAAVIGLVDGGILWWLDHPGETDRDGLTDWLAAQVLLLLGE